MGIYSRTDAAVAKCTTRRRVIIAGGISRRVLLIRDRNINDESISNSSFAPANGLYCAERYIVPPDFFLPD